MLQDFRLTKTSFCKLLLWDSLEYIPRWNGVTYPYICIGIMIVTSTLALCSEMFLVLTCLLELVVAILITFYGMEMVGTCFIESPQEEVDKPRVVNVQPVNISKKWIDCSSFWASMLPQL